MSGSPDQHLKRGFDSVRTLDSRFTHVLPIHIITTSLYLYCIIFLCNIELNVSIIIFIKLMTKSVITQYSLQYKFKDNGLTQSWS